MTSATSILRKEHDAILRMLDVTEELARRLERGERVAAEMLTDLLEFFRVFADRCHHAKEEDFLFPSLENRGMPYPGGPTEVMRAEHERARALIREMQEAAEDYSQNVPGAGGRWSEAARAYAILLHAHIDKENNVLFEMADLLLSEIEQRELTEAFEKLEEEKMGAGTHARLHRVMEKLTVEVFARSR